METYRAYQAADSRRREAEELLHDPEMKDIGILASLDPVALDQACLDLVHAVRPSEGNNSKPLIERIKSRNGQHTVDHAERIGMGSKKYELVELQL